jgi:inner membrane protein
VDNVCHSLAGAVLAECGFAKRSRFATVAMVIAANIPDVDVGYIFLNQLTGLESRRGWTHSVPALALWPFVVVGLVLLWQRFRKRQPPASAPPLNLALLLIGCAIAVLSHPFLDWMNEYGVRVLIPWSGRWFYGDTLFIVDLVLLLLFGGGWWLARRRRGHDRTRSAYVARAAVLAALLYIVIMRVQSERSRAAVEMALGRGPLNAHQLMIGPLAASMLTRSALIVTDSGYILRNVHAGLRVSIGAVTEFVPTNANDPLSRAARATDEYRRFMRWSRFPYFVPAAAGESTVFVGDARYARGASTTWAGTLIRLSRSP